MNFTKSTCALIVLSVFFVACSNSVPTETIDEKTSSKSKEDLVEKSLPDEPEQKLSPEIPASKQRSENEKDQNNLSMSEPESKKLVQFECVESVTEESLGIIIPGQRHEEVMSISNSRIVVKSNVNCDKPYAQQAANVPAAGQLTAGEINDFSKWKLWDDVAEGDLALYQMRWRINPIERFSATVQNNDGMPVSDCKVELLSNEGKVLWTSRTDNTGKAELWNNMYTSESKSSSGILRCSYQGKIKEIKKPKLFSRGMNSFVLDVPCDFSDNVDILFAVDATGSMGDEIEYLKSELADIIRKTSANKPELEIQLGTIFYKCVGNSYVTKPSPFSKNVNTTVDFIGQQSASEGGTEAVEIALHEAVNNYSWSSKARTRILFMVLDEPPGVDAETVGKMHKAIQEAAEKGIRVVPLVSSGVNHDIDKSLEYLMRSIALATNGTYAFLTDHSGIGNAHTAPSTDNYKVEKLNDLMIRIIDQFTEVQDCTSDELPVLSDTTIVVTQVQDILESSELTLSVFPNPAHRHVTIQSNEDLTEVLIMDSNGKLILRAVPNSKSIRFELDEFTNGFYIARCKSGEQWHQLKFVISK
jgi:hypothetical protein